MSNGINTVPTGDLKQLLLGTGVQLIDVRSIDSYNGWRLQGEARSGHIPGARSFPVKWLNYLDWPEILAEKHLSPDKELIIYGSEATEINSAAKAFRNLGFNRLSAYYGFLDEWNPNPNLSLTFLPRFQHLVPAQWLKQLLDSGTAPEYDNDNFVLCHAHYQNRATYDQGHIAGAIELDTNLLESSDTWNRRSPSELKSALEGLGITQDTTVILYGRFSAPTMKDSHPGSNAGHLGAMRCAFLMLYAGVKDVRILNGGLHAWEDSGYGVITASPSKHPIVDFGTIVPARSELAIDTPEARVYLASPEANLVSVRSWSEFTGEVSGYHYIKVKGRISGAVFGNCGSDAYHMENYRNPDHTTREFQDLASMWAEAGITPDKRNAFYCGTGWRGSEAFINAWLMGWSNISVYDGGWYEWSRDPANPIETGIPRNLSP